MIVSLSAFVFGFVAGWWGYHLRVQRRMAMLEAIQSGMLAAYGAQMMKEVGLKQIPGLDPKKFDPDADLPEKKGG